MSHFSLSSPIISVKLFSSFASFKTEIPTESRALAALEISSASIISPSSSSPLTWRTRNRMVCKPRAISEPLLCVAAVVAPIRAAKDASDSPALAKAEPATVYASAIFPISVAFWSAIDDTPSSIAQRRSAEPPICQAASAASINFDAVSSVTPPIFCVTRDSSVRSFMFSR